MRIISSPTSNRLFVTNQERNESLHHCNVVCNADGACSDTVAIDCASSEFCDVECMGHGSCDEAGVRAEHADSLDMLCEDSSCNDLILHCPHNPKQCKLAGQGDEHSSFTIFAVDSWDDLNLAHYSAKLDHMDSIQPTNETSVMFCGENFQHQCVMTNDAEFVGRWNCLDLLSPCYQFGAVTNSTVVCEGTECAGTVLECDGSSGEDCGFQCRGAGSCAGSTFNCAGGLSCNVECASPGACEGATVNCGTGEGTCAVTANAANAMSNAVVNGGGSAGTNTRRLLDISQGVVMAACAGMESCKNVVFNAEYSSYLEVDCIGLNGCGDIDVYCPENVAQNKKCVLRGGNKDIHRNLNFYAIHGFADLYISEYNAILENTSIINNVTEERESKNLNRMHCGAAEDGYPSFCRLNASLLCDCGEGEEKKGGGNILDSNQWAAAIIILIVLLIGSGVVVYWMIIKNGNNKREDQYSTVRNGDDGDDEDTHQNGDHHHDKEEDDHHFDDDTLDIEQSGMPTRRAISPLTDQTGQTSPVSSRQSEEILSHLSQSGVSLRSAWAHRFSNKQLELVDEDTDTSLHGGPPPHGEARIKPRPPPRDSRETMELLPPYPRDREQVDV